MTVTTLKHRLQQGELVRVLGVGRVMHHSILQMIGLSGGYHGLWFDQEHCGVSVPEIEIGAMAARAHGMDTFVRIAPTDYATVTQCMEAGSSGIMAAQIESAEQAEEIVRWSKFYPRGARGLNSGGWDGDFGNMPLAEFCEKANRDSFVVIQIETAGAVEDCEKIAAIDGVDLLFVGPSDLSQNLGVTGQLFHEKCISAIDRVAAACQKHGKQWGAVCAGADHADMLLDKGCRMISPTADVKLVQLGLAAVEQAYPKLFN